jgi:GT2 family glycosyltransferase
MEDFLFSTLGHYCHEIYPDSFREFALDIKCTRSKNITIAKMENSRLSIVIVNWNTKELLRRCIESIYKTTNKRLFEIIIIDNGSTDRSQDMVRECYAGVKLISNVSNVGFARACNQGIGLSQSEYVLLLNSDTVVNGDALERMVAGMDAHKKLGACTSRIINADRTEQFVGRSFPTLPNLFIKLFSPDKIYSFLTKTIYNLLHERRKELFLIDCLTGAVCMMRKNVIDRLKGLDEALPFYAEDIDLCYRIKKAGWEIGCFIDAVIMHVGQQSSQKIPVTAEVASRRSIYAYYKKHYGRVYKVIVWLMIYMSSFLRYIVWSILFRATRTEDALFNRKAYKILLYHSLNNLVNIEMFSKEHNGLIDSD